MTGFYGETETGTLERTVVVLERLVDEARVVIGKSAFKSRMADPANAGMVDIELMESDWEQYEPQGVDAFGINLGRMKEIVGQLEGETTSLEIVDAGARLQIRGDHIQYNMSLIDPQSIREHVDNAPDAVDDAAIEMPGSELRRGVQACEVLVEDDEPLRFTAVDGDLKISAEEDNDEAEYVCEDAGVVSEGEAEALFSLSYIEPISKQVADHHLTIYLKNDHPVFMDFAFTESGASSARYTVAPRIENE